MTEINIQIIDYYSTFGAFIDREKNSTLGVSENATFLGRRQGANFKSYMPGIDHIGGVGELEMNL